MRAPLQSLCIHVRPRSTRAGISLRADGALVVHLHAPAAEGAANRELITLLARAAGVPPSAVRIVGGERSRRKQITAQGLPTAELQRRLRQAAAQGDAR